VTEEEFSARVDRLMFYLARRLAPNGDGYEDLAQIGALGALNLFRRQGGETMPDIALVKTAAKRAMYHEIRTQHAKKRTGGERIPLYEDILDEQHRESAVIRRIDVYRALDQLNPREREIIEFTLAGLTSAEIARGIDLSEGRVSQLKKAAVTKLQQILAA
jgi:RNA polymerase sigma factor (sigma-70 family)